MAKPTYTITIRLNVEEYEHFAKVAEKNGKSVTHVITHTVKEAANAGK